MNNLNSILLEGSLVRDPVLNYTSKGTPECTFCLSSNRFYKENDEYHREVCHFDVTVWGKLAETCAEYLQTGSGVRVVGRLKQDQSEEGNGQSRVYIVAEHVEFKPVPSEKSKQVS